jgi:ferritin-like metal-binding protein YciE
VKRLERVFQLLCKEAKGVDCPAIDGIISEANEVVGEVEDRAALMQRSLPLRKRWSTTRSRATAV